MKKMMIAAAILFSSFAFATDPSVNEKALKSFATSFPNAQKVAWYTNEKSFEVSFFDNDIRCRMFYSRDGELVSMLRYYGENKLSPFILEKVNDQFEYKRVFGVTEVSTHDGIIYKLVLEDGKNWYHVTSDAAGNMNMDKKYRKA